MKHLKIGSIIIGLFLIFVGVGYSGNVLNIWDFTIFFDGWWTLFIIIPCIYSLFNSGYNTASMLGLLAGVLFLLNAQGIINVNIVKLIIPIILILIGLKFIFRGKFFNKKIIKDLRNPQNCEYGAYFGTQFLNYNGLNFEGNSLNSVFGTLKMDLRGSTIPHDCVIDFNCVFGGIEVMLPENVNIKINSNPIFGGVSNKYKPSAINNENCVTIYLTGSVIFGGVDIY